MLPCMLSSLFELDPLNVTPASVPNVLPIKSGFVPEKVALSVTVVLASNIIESPLKVISASSLNVLLWNITLSPLKLMVSSNVLMFPF